MNTCFVVMPIAVPVDYLEVYSDRELHFSHVYTHLFIPALTQCGYDVIPPAATGSEIIHAEIIRNLEQADFVLCDISCANPNVFFELGIRTALDRPIAIVKDNHTKRIPFDTGSINTHTYDASLTPWSLETEVSTLQEHIGQTAKKGDGRNPLWRYFGLTRQASPPEIANPVESKLDLILNELIKLSPSSNLAAGRAIFGALEQHAEKPKTEPASLEVARKAAYNEGVAFAQSLARDAPQLWVEAVLARKPRMPSETEAKMLQQSDLPIDYLLMDEIRHALRNGFWAGMEAHRQSSGS
jgi:hypothetical protein